MNDSIDANEQATLELNLATGNLTIFSPNELLEPVKVRLYIIAYTERFSRHAIFYYNFFVQFYSSLQIITTIRTTHHQSIQHRHDHHARSRHLFSNQDYSEASKYVTTYFLIVCSSRIIWLETR